MKSTSHYALAAAAGLFAGALAISPAHAADLGGDCCADLEERVAELEATTVRKGNRVVSVQLYGQIHKALMVWDDGIDSDAYVVDQDISSSRFGARGSATIKPGWTAGFRYEIEFQSAESNRVAQDYAGLPGDDGLGSDDINTRRASLYVESAQLGRVTMGLTSLATDDLVYTYLGSVNVTGAEFNGSGLRLRTSDGGFVGGVGFDGSGDLVGAGIGNAIRLGSIATDTDIGRDDAIRYDSPSIYGFIFSAAWGESDKADVALRFKKEWNSIQIVAAAGYRWDGDNDKEFLKGEALSSGSIRRTDEETLILSGGIKHTPSGLFLNGVWVQQDRDGLRKQLGDTEVTIGSGDFDVGTEADLDPSSVEGGGITPEAFDPTTVSITENLTANVTEQAARAASDEATYWQVFGGIERNWTGMGLTSIFGRYIQYEDFGAGQIADFDSDGFADDVLTGSEVNVWGFGIEQDFDSAALEIYAHFNYFEIDDVSYRTINGNSPGELDEFNLVTESGKADAEDIWVGYLGTRIKF